MVDTIKFSQFADAGDLEPNESTVGVNAGVNSRYNNPFPLLPPGTTAQRPTPAPSMYYRLRFNTTLEVYEYYSPTLVDWVQLVDSAPSLVGPYVTYTADPTLPNAFDLGLLSNGLLKQSVSLGVATPAIAIPGVDYYGPGGSPIPISEGGTGANNAADARTNLGLGTIAVQDANNVNIGGGVANLTAGSVLSTPTLPTDLVNKSYADSISAGFTFKGSAFVASTVNLNATYFNGTAGVGATLTSNVNGVLTLDGLNPNALQRVVIKDQTNTYENGIYDVTDAGSVSTPYIITRATDFDTAAEIVPGAIVFIQDGNTYADTSFVQTEPVFTVGTDPILFTQFSQQYPLSMGNGGTGANLTPSANSLVYSNASTMALLPTANNGVLVTSAGGVPSISSVLPSGLTIPGFAHSGANSDITSMTGLTGQLRSPTAVADSAGNPCMTWTYVPSAVNYWQFANTTAGNPITWGAGGSDTDINITGATKGIGVWSFLSANTAVPMQILSGTAYQHTTQFVIPNTAATRAVTFQDASGTMAYLADRGWVLISSATASNSAALTFTGLTGYSNYMIVYNCLTPVTNGAIFLFQGSIDNGSTWLSTAASYYQQSLFYTNTSVGAGSDVTTLTAGVLSSNILNSVPGPSGYLMFQNLNGATRKGYIGQTIYVNSNTSTLGGMQQCGWIATGTLVNALRLIMSSGNISNGTAQIYGMK